jgi:hypothetical protein
MSNIPDNLADRLDRWMDDQGIPTWVRDELGHTMRRLDFVNELLEKVTSCDWDCDCDETGGYDSGYERGYEDGYDEGMTDARAEADDES